MLQHGHPAHDQVVKICPACSREYGDEHSHCRDDGVVLVHLDTGTNERVQDLIGQIVDGRYRIERIVGRGGMGTVYACRHVVVGKAFAMKVLRPGIERSEEILQRFIREAQAANAVQSRHICEMTDFGQLANGAFYVVMELLQGMSLTRALRERRLTRRDIKHVFVQVADTLDKAHRAGIIHRDLKPDNVVLVMDDGDPHFVKLVDFGIAKLLHTKASSLTETGVILGTPYYMSPEQARGDPVDHRSDIYALGVMMYRAFTGKLPFVADTAMGVLTRHLMEKPELPSRITEMDRKLEQVILRCLEKRPIDRFQTMADLADALRSVPDEIMPPRSSDVTLDERSAIRGGDTMPDSAPTPTKVATPQAREKLYSSEHNPAPHAPAFAPPLPRDMRSSAPPYTVTPVSGQQVMPPHGGPTISSDAHRIPPGLGPAPSPAPGSMTPLSHDPRLALGPMPDPLLGEAATNRGVVSSRFTPIRPRQQRTIVWVVAAVMLTCAGAAAGLMVLFSTNSTPAAAPAATEAPPPEEPPEIDDVDEPAPQQPTASATSEASAKARASVKPGLGRPRPQPAPSAAASDDPSETPEPRPEIRSPFEKD